MTAGGDDGWAKVVGRFDPLASLPLAECERHYTEVHFPFAQRQLRTMPHVVTYHTNRVTAELDLAGGWRQRPRAWRFVLLRFQPGRALGFPPDVAEAVAQDHRNVLSNLRSYQVREDVRLDRLTGQTALAKYLFEVDRDPAVPAQESADRLAAGIGRLRDLAADAYGLRLLTADWVLSERAATPIDEPGQRPSPVPLPSTDRLAYLELYADAEEWAEQWLATPDVRAVLRDPFFPSFAGYRVEERCGLDTR